MPRYGGRKPLTEAGPGLHVAARLPRELVDDLKAMAEEIGEPVSEIVRRGAASEVKKWKKRTGRA